MPFQIDISVYFFVAFICVLLCALLVLARVLFFRGDGNAGARRDGRTDAGRPILEADLMALSDRMERLVTLLEERMTRHEQRLSERIVALGKGVEGMERVAAIMAENADNSVTAQPAEGGVAVPEDMARLAAAEQPPAADMKAERVMTLYRKGLPQDEIARRLGMPQGAVALIIGIGGKNQ